LAAATAPRSLSWVEALNPRMALISVDARYGPARPVLERLAGRTILRTDLNATAAPSLIYCACVFFIQCDSLFRARKLRKSQFIGTTINVVFVTSRTQRA
jgi:hypothetical protein